MAVFGIDGPGHLALQYAGILGGECVAVDVTEERLVMAKRLGAAHVVNAAEIDPISAIGALGGADVAVVLAPGPRVVEQAHASLRRGGRWSWRRRCATTGCRSSRRCSRTSG
nr:hypothetical protein GCM10020092_068570 [Actinoplanes digitatis]